MKKIGLIYSVLVFASAAFSFCFAQHPQLIGMTYGGGAHACGTIFKMSADGSALETVFSFDTLTGMNPYGKLLQADNGLLYGMTFKGGSHHYGVLFSFNPITYTYTDLYHFNLPDGGAPYGSLIQANNGKLYGMTSTGGSKNNGVILSFDPVNQLYEKLFDFVDSLGGIPKGDLLQASNGKFYGMSSFGGATYKGTLFSFDPATNIYTKKVDFSPTNGTFPFGSLVEDEKGTLYGTARFGGTNNSGVLFSYSPSTDSYIKLLNFPGGPLVNPSSGVTFVNDRLYGMTLQGGLNNVGSVYSFDTLSRAYSSVQDFDSINGASPQFNTLLQASNGKLYGMTTNGGLNNDGVIFTIDPTTSTYSKLIDFNGVNGKSPYGTLLELQIPTGAQTKKDGSGFLIYPNPVSNELRIQHIEQRVKEITIYNVLGKMVSSTTIKRSEDTIAVDVSKLPAGIYFLQLQSEKNCVTKKFVKD